MYVFWISIFPYTINVASIRSEQKKNAKLRVRNVNNSLILILSDFRK